MKRSSLVLCLTIGVFGCKDEPSKPGPSAASGAVSASATGSLRVVEEAPIEVSEDGNLTRRVAVADLEEPVALSSLVKSAPDEWVWLQVKSADGRAMTIADVTETYDRLRENSRMRGRPVASLGDGSCGGCNTQLPVQEYERLRGAEPDALIRCPGCHRIFVR